ncbi:MAG: hypothetical protein HOO86_05750 [Bacteroidales bacterium]|nr:hypothetical protein [Bacteroidales bacterium]
MKKLIAILLFLPLIVFCQLTDDFDDGDFTANPTWIGTTDNFIINSSSQLQLNATGEGNSYLSSSFNSEGTTEWRFFIRLNFSPSGSNFSRVFLSSDVADLTAQANGYFLQFGEAGSNDAIELFKKQGNETLSICRGTDGLLSTAFSLWVKVIRNAAGEWTIFTDHSGTGAYSQQAMGTDNTFQPSGFFGFYCQYTTSNSTKMYLDEVYAGNQIIDTVAPYITELVVNDPFNLSLTFSEPTDSVSAKQVLNYLVDGGIGHPDTVIMGTNTTFLSLRFINSFGNGLTNTLVVSNIGDLTGNIMIDTSMQFTLYEAVANDVVINEIMADPSPGVGLPEWEFIELYNTTPYRIDISGWKLMIGDSEKLIESCEMFPFSYLLLIHDDAVTEYSEYGDVTSFESFQLSNAGTSLKLLSDNGLLVSSVNYTDEWYHDSDKDDGGWSLEQIDPSNTCGGKNNWTASTALQGGTPNLKNAANATNITPPYPERFSVPTNKFVQIWFDQYMDEASATTVTNYNLNPGNSNPSLVLLNENEPEFVQLVFDQPFETGIIYTLNIDQMVLNCSGTPVPEGTQLNFGIPDPVAEGDIIINEVLFNPLGDGVDYVEIYNKTDKIFDLAQIMLGGVSQTIPNPPDTNLKIISETSRLMLPETYVLLTVSISTVLDQFESLHPENFVEMASLPTFSNDDGTVLITTKYGLMIDAFSYTDNMHFPLLTTTEGVSLERISFDVPSTETSNWHSAAQTVGFGTPGYQNSMFSAMIQTSGEITIDPEIFSPDSDGKDDVTALGFQFDQAGYTLNAFVFDANGIEKRHLVKSALIPAEGIFYWDGEDDEGNKVPVGIYIIMVEVFNLEGKVENYKKAVVVGVR